MQELFTSTSTYSDGLKPLYNNFKTITDKLGMPESELLPDDGSEWYYGNINGEKTDVSTYFNDDNLKCLTSYNRQYLPITSGWKCRPRSIEDINSLKESGYYDKPCCYSTESRNGLTSEWVNGPNGDSIYPTGDGIYAEEDTRIINDCGLFGQCCRPEVGYQGGIGSKQQNDYLNNNPNALCQQPYLEENPTCTISTNTGSCKTVNESSSYFQTSDCGILNSDSMNYGSCSQWYVCNSTTNVQNADGNTCNPTSTDCTLCQNIL